MFGRTKLKSYSHSDGLVHFFLPKNWVSETEDDGNSVFWCEQDDFGSLRVTTLTAKNEDTPAENPELYLLGYNPSLPSPIYLENGNALRKYTNEAYEDGQELLVYWYEIANHVKPIYHRLAIFSFTILKSQVDNPKVNEQVSMLEEQIPKAEFRKDLHITET